MLKNPVLILKYKECKKANVVPFFKKSNKQKLKDYQPISWLPVSGKALERLFYCSIFKFFTENILILHQQSGFKPGDSSANQLLSTTHKIYNLFDGGQKVQFVFFDISKTFDKVWYKAMIFKLKQMLHQILIEFAMNNIRLVKKTTFLKSLN